MTNATAQQTQRQSAPAQKAPRIPMEPGKRFGRLVVVRFSHPSPGGSKWLCRCDCGNETTVKIGKLTMGITRSCGCLRRQNCEQLKLSHGHARAGRHSKTFTRWKGMLARCTDPNHKAFKNYGGRGITVCERWRDFANFLSDMGEAPDGMLIDRTDNDGNYEPGNCRWVTPKESANNRRPRNGGVK